MLACVARADDGGGGRVGRARHSLSCASQAAPARARAARGTSPPTSRRTSLAGAPLPRRGTRWACSRGNAAAACGRDDGSCRCCRACDCSCMLSRPCVRGVLLALAMSSCDALRPSRQSAACPRHFPSDGQAPTPARNAMLATRAYEAHVVRLLLLQR
eukprot:scaffold1754_cov355-Prasinococcus_capsulatus_cf.AAC.5